MKYIKSYIVLDIETSVQPDKALSNGGPVVRISALPIHVETLEPLADPFDVKIKFKDSDDYILSLIGWSEESWQEAKLPREAFSQFKNFLLPYCWVGIEYPGGALRQCPILIGHNLFGFDIPVLYRWVDVLKDYYKDYYTKQELDSDFNLPIYFNLGIDTLALIRTISHFTGEFVGKASLGYLMDKLRHEFDHHDSLSDVEATRILFKYLLEKFKLQLKLPS